MQSKDYIESRNFPRSAGKHAGDPFLRVLQFFARSGIEFSLVLSVRGQTISGTAISRERWFELWRGEVRAAGGETVAKAFERFDDEQFYLHEGEIPDSDPPSRVYLMNARMGNSSRDSLIRVESASVDAWSMGDSPRRYPPRQQPTAAAADGDGD